jgi:anti-sigma factor RsiW
MSEHLDGELAPAGRTRIEHHLGECAACRRLLADLRRILDGLHRLAPPSPGTNAPQIAAAVRARLSEPN